MSTWEVMKYYKGLMVIILVFGIIGITFMVTAGVVASITDKYKGDDYMQVVGEISSIEFPFGIFSDEDDAIVWVKYAVDQEQYEKKIDSYSDSMRQGDQVTLYVNKVNPLDISYAEDLEVIPIVFGCIGGVFFLVSAICFIVLLSKKNKINHLIVYGARIRASVVGVEENNLVSVNSVHPFRIVCQYVDTTREITHTYRSQDLWGYPDYYQMGEEITVFVDKDDPERYFMDMREINQRRNEIRANRNVQSI